MKNTISQRWRQSRGLPLQIPQAAEKSGQIKKKNLNTGESSGSQERKNILNLLDTKQPTKKQDWWESDFTLATLIVRR